MCINKQSPNELLVSVIQARNLQVMKTNMFSAGGGSDPFVKVAVDNFPNQHTGYIKNTLVPVWNERFKFPHLHDQSSTLQLSVYDHNVTRKKFMGRVIVPLYDFHDKKSKMKWYKLLAKTENDGKERGEIQVTIHWHFNAAVDEAERKQAEQDSKSAFKRMGGFIHKASNLVSGEVDDDAMEEAEDDVS